MAICGAAPASPELFRILQCPGGPLTGRVRPDRIAPGSSPSSAWSAPAGDMWASRSPGVEVKIAEDGEILAKGASVFKGYFKNPELTAETVKDGWLYTGDVGALEDGFLKIMDRKKDILITAGGKNITPAFIENKLKFSPYIQDAVVIGDGRKFLWP